MNNLIGISGNLKNGKDLVGDMLQYIDECTLTSRPVSFDRFELDGLYLGKYYIRKCADKLKDCVCLLLGCTRKQLEDRDFKEKELGEEWRVWYCPNSFEPHLIFGSKEEAENSYIWLKDPFKPKVIESYLLTPRKILQLFGTQGGRMVVHPNIWVNALFADYKSGYVEQGVGWIETEDDYPYWIITDVRFPDNEGKAVSKRGGLNIGIRRLFALRFPEYAYLVNVDDSPYDVPDSLKDIDPELYKNLNHESETSMGDHSWCDVVIENNGTIEALFEKVLNAVQDNE